MALRVGRMWHVVPLNYSFPYSFPRKLESELVDVDAYVPSHGYLSANDFHAPDAAAAFAAKAEEFRKMHIPVSGDFASGSIDSSECCRIIAKVAGLQKPCGWFSSDQVKEMFRNAQWPDFEALPRATKEWDISEFSNHLVAKSFVDLCVQYNLEIRFD